MSLEDFFTLTEMKDGLTTLARVEELISVMQNHEYSVSSNVGDTARQLTNVARILSATENHDCLNHFVQLNGLLVWNQWLQEVCKSIENNSECSLEEVINALLRALDKLPVNNEKVSASGISPTIKQLICYKNHDIQGKLSVLLDKWGHSEDGDSKSKSMDKHASCFVEDRKPSQASGINEENKPTLNPDFKISLSDAEPGDYSKRYSNSFLDDAPKGVEHTCNQILYHVSSSLNMSVLCPVAQQVGACDLISQEKNLDSRSDIHGRKDVSDSPKDMKNEANVEDCIPKRITEGLCLQMEGSLDMNGTEVDSDSVSSISRGVDSVISYASMKPPSDVNVSEMDEKSEIGLGYGEIDALEVARQVAIEVEREVVDYREPFYSSPEGISQGLDSCNSESMENNMEKPSCEQLNEHESPVAEDNPHSNIMRNRDKTIGIKIKHVYQPESPQSSLVQECVSNVVKKYDFDLNVDVCLEEADCQVVQTTNQNIKLSTPILVASSKGRPTFSVNMPQFQGCHGWRGCAPTSAFHSGSSWRSSDGEKMVSGPKKNPNFLKIDLNETIGEDDVAGCQQTAAFSSSPSRESTSVVNSRKAEICQLDLNHSGDSGEADTLPNQIPFWKHVQNSGLSLSSASASSFKQLSFKDFDLNDIPSFIDAYDSNSHSNSSKVDLGSRIPVERGLPGTKTSQPSLNGQGIDSAISTTKVSVPYPPMSPPPSGYNGLVMEPALSFPATFCGPGSIPYILDSRGASVTVIPQVLGSTGLSGATVRAPFVVSKVGATVGSNAIRLSQPGMDFNSGTNSSEECFTQFFIQGNSSKMEEQLRPPSQPAGSRMVLKRREPDGGWEPCTLDYKQVAPWR